MVTAPALVLVLAASAVAQAPAPPPAPEQLAVTVSNDLTLDHLWSGQPVVVRGLATLPDGAPAVGRTLIIESRPYPYTAPFTEEARIVVAAGGTFSYTKRPQRNLQLRVRGEAGQPSQITNLRVFHLALSGRIKALGGGRQQASEVSAIPVGYKLARAYLYFCRPKAKRCQYMSTGKARISGQRMTAKATFRPVARYADKNWRVIFRYVPRAGWGDSTASERRKPRRTIANLDQTGA
jgi:hypothetical protein